MRDILVCCLLVFSAGCFLGDQGTARIVSVSLPLLGRQSTVSLSVADPAVQESLGRIEGVLTSNGLRRIPNPQVPSSDGSIVHYEGPPTSGCSVSLKDDEVLVVFFEFGDRRSSDDVKHICSLLERDLESRYGAKNVTVKQRR